jgi:hypothetical protein
VRDARPAVLSLVWDTDRQHPLAEGLVAVAAELADVERDGGVATNGVAPLV